MPDFALIKSYRGDRWGNLTYNKTARNIEPIIAMAADRSIAQVESVVALGGLDPEIVITPGSSCNGSCGRRHRLLPVEPLPWAPPGIDWVWP